MFIFTILDTKNEIQIQDAKRFLICFLFCHVSPLYVEEAA